MDINNWGVVTKKIEDILESYLDENIPLYYHIMYKLFDFVPSQKGIEYNYQITTIEGGVEIFFRIWDIRNGTEDRIYKIRKCM